MNMGETAIAGSSYYYPSPVWLNNKGVLFLEAGNCEHAACCFRDATQEILSAIPHMLPKLNALDLPLDADHKTSFNVERCKSGETSKRKEIPVTVDDPKSRKRCRLEEGNVARGLGVLPNHSLGRPLWIESVGGKNSSFGISYLSAIILYNLGLTFHLIASSKSNSNAEDTNMSELRKALVLYEMSLEITQRQPLHRLMQGPVVVVLLHNIMQVHGILDSPDLFQLYRNKLSQLIRMIAAKGGVEEVHYEEFYMKLLTLQNVTDLAAAA